MAWGHSEDIALDSGGNFSRFFSSLSPEVFCVRNFFLLLLDLALPSALFRKGVEKLLFLDDDGRFFFSSFTFGMQSSSGSRVEQFSHTFHGMLGPKPKFAHFFRTNVANFETICCKLHSLAARNSAGTTL